MSFTSTSSQGRLNRLPIAKELDMSQTNVPSFVGFKIMLPEDEYRKLVEPVNASNNEPLFLHDMIVYGRSHSGNMAQVCSHRCPMVKLDEARKDNAVVISPESEVRSHIE